MNGQNTSPAGAAIGGGRGRVLELEFLLSTIWKKRTIVGAITTVSFLFFVSLALILPKQYKSVAIINIYNKYFQAGLVKEFAPQTESGELRGQIESLAKRALSDDFIRITGEKYQIFKQDPHSPLRNAEMELLAKRFEFFAYNPSTYQLSFTTNDPVIARDVARDALQALEKTLVDERLKTIISMRDSIRKRVEIIAMGKSDTVDPLAFERVDLLSEELNKTRAELKSLQMRFTDSHPEVARLIARTKRIESLITAQGAQNAKINEGSRPYIGEGAKDSNNEVYQELVKKLNYLNITLDQESSGLPSYYGIVQNPVVPPAPTWPSKSAFAVWGTLVGFVFSIMFIAANEYLSQSSADPHEVARRLQVPLLGTLPSFSWNIRPGAKPQESGKSEMSDPSGWQ